MTFSLLRPSQIALIATLCAPAGGCGVLSTTASIATTAVSTTATVGSAAVSGVTTVAGAGASAVKAGGGTAGGS